MTYSVILSDEAKRNIAEIRDWIAERSPDGARRWFNALDTALQRLSHNPRLPQHAPENEYASQDVRNILFRTPKGRVYRAVYFVEGETVYVTHVRGPGQQLIPPNELD